MELIVRLDGLEERIRLERRGSRYLVEIGERTYDVDIECCGDSSRSLIIAGRQYEVAVKAGGDGRFQIASSHGLDEVEVLDPLTHLARQTHTVEGLSGPMEITADMPGRVVDLLVEEGASVSAGDGVVVLEAMKMENEIRSARDGIVSRLFVDQGQAVEVGDPLFQIE